MKPIITIYKGYITYRLFKWVMTRQRFDSVQDAFDFHKELLKEKQL